MEENLEISKSLLLRQSKFFLFLSLSLSEKKNRSTLSLSLSLSLSLRLRFLSFVQRWVLSATERELMICSRRFVSLFKKFLSSGSWIFEKKKWRVQFIWTQSWKKEKYISEFNQLCHTRTTTVNEEEQNTLLLTHTALNTNNIPKY